jgi:hypothetical protein
MSARGHWLLRQGIIWVSFISLGHAEEFWAFLWCFWAIVCQLHESFYQPRATGHSIKVLLFGPFVLVWPF